MFGTSLDLASSCNCWGGRDTIIAGKDRYPFSRQQLITPVWHGIWWWVMKNGDEMTGCQLRKRHVSGKLNPFMTTLKCMHNKSSFPPPPPPLDTILRLQNRAIIVLPVVIEPHMITMQYTEFLGRFKLSLKFCKIGSRTIDQRHR